MRRRILRTVIGLMGVLAAVGAAAGAESLGQDAAGALYDPGGRRDPFAPLVLNGRYVGQEGTRAFSAIRPELYGILWDPAGNSIALINDGEARVGDAVGGYRVEEIRKDAVVLRNGGEPVVLTISFESPVSGTSDLTGGEGQ